MLPARVAAQHRGSYILVTEHGSFSASLTGHLRRDETPASGRPAVGDWVVASPIPEEQKALIHDLLPRTTAISRKVAGLGTDEQVLAANVDTLFLLSSLNSELNPRRIERYLTMAWDSGAAPVIVLTKSDLIEDVRSAILEVQAIAPAVPIHPVSNLSGEGFEKLAAYLSPGRTVALLGSSGVGKSSLVNRLAGEDRQKVKEIREDDDRGRHTTTHRELIPLPCGGLVIDTPGLRELQLWESQEGIDHAFSDVAELAAGCRFTDCAHDSEPGCEVKAGLRDGRLRADRLESYRKLQRELRYLKRKQDHRAAAQETRKIKRLSRQIKEQRSDVPYY